MAPEIMSYFRVGILYAVESLVKHLVPDNSASVAEITSVLKRFAITAAFDYEIGADVVEEHIDKLRQLEEAHLIYRKVLELSVAATLPEWAHKAHYGREAIASKIPSEALQCLTLARLMDDSRASAEWWEQLKQIARDKMDVAKKISGAKAEQLSFCHERRKLRHYGIDLEPRHSSLFNEQLGFDILSYQRAAANVEELAIEVKACASTPLYFYVTQNEWTIAKRRQSQYKFHIWHMPTERLYEIPVADIEGQIPLNQGKGRWQNVLIAFKPQAHHAGTRFDDDAGAT